MSDRVTRSKAREVMASSTAAADESRNAELLQSSLQPGPAQVVIRRHVMVQHADEATSQSSTLTRGSSAPQGQKWKAVSALKYPARNTRGSMVARVKKEKSAQKVAEEMPTLPCPLCYDDLFTMSVSITVCGHMMCTNCLKEIITNHRFVCPLCNSKRFGCETHRAYLPPLRKP